VSQADGRQQSIRPVSPLHIPIELRDEFVYEYIGEVVSQTSFLKRMQQYADEGIQHFYFMMLQKEEVIDSLGHNALTTVIERLAHFHSISTQQRKVVLPDSPTTHAIQTVTSQNGLSASVCEWESLPSGTYNVEKS
jgi:hypothetical protein